MPEKLYFERMQWEPNASQAGDSRL